MCAEEGKLDADRQVLFRRFCEILSAYYHFQFHAVLERLKDRFFRIDPDSPFRRYKEADSGTNAQETESFFTDIQSLLIKANFQPLREKELRESFQNQSLIHLSTDVDFDDFERYLFYWRGSKTSKGFIRKFRYLKKEISFETLDRVVLLVRFKNRDYFENKKVNLKKLHFIPGQTYLFYFKNVPKADLEIIFPNVKISMTLKDKLFFLLPLFGVGLSTLFKMYGNLLILIGLILLAFGLTSYLDTLGISPDIIPNRMTSLIAVVASITIVLGGFAIKQYLNYKNKWIEFLNDVTQNLFFRSISINSGVFQSLIDTAEEEECKEAILAYYHLLTHEKSMTPAELDAHIEAWFRDRFQTGLNFDIEDALHKLQCLRTAIDSTETCLIERDAEGRLTVLPLDRALPLLDAIWDQIFQYPPCEAFRK